MIQQVGSWGYLVLLLLAIVAGYAYPGNAQYLQAFLLLGVVAGLVSFKGKPRAAVTDTGGALLLASIALNAVLGTTALNYLAAFVAPAAVLVALKTAREAV